MDQQYRDGHEEVSDGSGDYGTSLLRRTIAPFCHSSVTYRASTLRLVNGFTEWLPCCLDKDLYIRMAAQGPPSLLPAEGSLKRLHESQYFEHQLPHKHIKRLIAQTFVRYRAVSLLGGSYFGILRPTLRLMLLTILEITRTRRALSRFVRIKRSWQNANPVLQVRNCHQ